MLIKNKISDEELVAIIERCCQKNFCTPEEACRIENISYKEYIGAVLRLEEKDKNKKKELEEEEKEKETQEYVREMLLKNNLICNDENEKEEDEPEIDF